MSGNQSSREGVPADDPSGAAGSGKVIVPRRRRRWIRRVLLVLGPMAILLVAAYVYMNSGRYVETDNAYVKSDTALITAEVGGRIESVAVSENQRVRAGDVLFRIDSKPYELAVERAQSQLEAVESFIESLEASYEQQLAQLELAKINIAFYEREFEREQELVESRAGTGADLDEARHDLEVARQQIPIIEQSIAQLRAQIGGQIVFGSAAGAAAVGSSLFSSNAAYRTVKSMVADARLDLDRVVVRAPFDGVVTQVPTVGRFVAPGSLVMALISDQDVWLEANYKETQLTHVEPGQRVTIHVDAYPESEWNGEVESISPATGAEFSVIPAQNASGNWVKVAQRVPVRIRVVDELQGPQLRAGMSAIVEVDTGFERPAPSFLGFLAVLRTSAATETVGTGDQG